jgi:hypothetical protein
MKKRETVLCIQSGWKIMFYILDFLYRLRYCISSKFLKQNLKIFNDSNFGLNVSNSFKLQENLDLKLLAIVLTNTLHINEF